MKYVYKVPKEIKIEDKKVDENGVEKKVSTNVKTYLVGEIEVDVPGYTEATKLAKDIRFKVNDDGSVVGLNQEEIGSKVIELCPKFIKKVDVKSDDGTMHFDRFEDLGCVEEGRNVLNDVFGIVMGGIKLGKK